MKYLKFVIAAFAASFFTLSAQAAFVDFSAEPEGVLNTGDTTFAGFPANVLTNSTLYITPGLGLGVCNAVDGGSDCVSSPMFDDAGGVEDIIQLDFSNPVNITSLSFVDVNGNSLNDSTAIVGYEFRFSDGKPRIRGIFGDKSFADLLILVSDGSLTNVSVANIFHGGSTNGQPFFISSIELVDPTAVPLPAALPLFLFGLAGLRMRARQTKPSIS